MAMNWTHEFELAVHKSFEFLTRLGYRSESEFIGDRSAQVRYWKNNDFEVTVGACPVRLEFDLNIARGDSEKMGLGELGLMFPGVHLPLFQHSIYDAHSDKDKLEAFISTLAERFKIIGMPVITGELPWDDVVRYVVRWRDEQEVKKKNAELSKAVAMAFKEERWNDVVIAVQTLGNQADELELKRLAYAQKCIAK